MEKIKINRKLFKYLAEGDTYEIAGQKVGFTGAKRTLQLKVKTELDSAIELANDNKLKETDKEMLSLARKRVENRLIRTDENDNLAIVFERKAQKALKAITPRKLKDSSAMQLMILAATAVDKARLLANESTANIAIRGNINFSELSNIELIERIKKMREDYAQRNNTS